MTQVFVLRMILRIRNYFYKRN